MLHRLRLACGETMEAKPLAGTVEIDETYIGGSQQTRKQARQGRQGGAGKAIVLGMRERGDKTKAIHDNVAAGATIYADELRGYSGAGGMIYKHEKVNRSAKEY